MSVCAVRCTSSAAVVGTTLCVCSNSWSNSNGCYMCMCVEWYVEPCVVQCRCVALSRDTVRFKRGKSIPTLVLPLATTHMTPLVCENAPPNRQYWVFFLWIPFFPHAHTHSHEAHLTLGNGVSRRRVESVRAGGTTFNQYE